MPTLPTLCITENSIDDNLSYAFWPESVSKVKIYYKLTNTQNTVPHGSTGSLPSHKGPLN